MREVREDGGDKEQGIVSGVPEQGTTAKGKEADSGTKAGSEGYGPPRLLWQAYRDIEIKEG